MARTSARLSRATIVAACVLLLLLAGGAGSAHASRLSAPTPTTPITNVVIFMLENHTFTSLFGRYPGVQNAVTLPESPNPMSSDINHSGSALIAAQDGGKMDEYLPHDYVQWGQSDIPTWWQYAQQFGLADNFYSSLATNSTPNHIALVSAGQNGGVWETVASNGCASPRNQLLLSRNTAGAESWSYPCSNIANVPQLLATNGLSWRYYNAVPIFDAPKYIQSLYGSSSDVHNPKQFLTDVQTGKLATVSWVVPVPTDHPPSALQAAQNWVSQQINALMQSSYWGHTAIFISWDDWGGMYDPVMPPQVDGLGLGPRVPLLVISPYAKAGYISHQQGEFASFARFIEENWGLPNLGQRDALPQTSDLMDFFDFTQAPRSPVLVSPISYLTGLNVINGPVSPTKSINGTVSPNIGGPSTTFTFSILYTPRTAPATHNITIDSTSHVMNSIGTVTGGTLYQYATTLAAGSHGYTFTFSTPGGPLTLPYNGVPFPGPEVHPFTLISVKAPFIAEQGQTIVFSTTYISPQNTAPTLAMVDVDGIAHGMSSNGTNYAKGVTFTYSANNLGIGQHYFRVRFDDGSGVAEYEGGSVPLITPVMVSNGTVSPTTGTTTTAFTFSATYTDAGGQTPISALLYVDQSAHPMSYVSGSMSTGALYQAQLTLSAGSHTFDFVFADGSSSWADPLGPAVFSGPSVGAVVAPPPGGSSSPLVLPPSHDDDPDYPLPGDTGN